MGLGSLACRQLRVWTVCSFNSSRWGNVKQGSAGGGWSDWMGDRTETGS